MNLADRKFSAYTTQSCDDVEAFTATVKWIFETLEDGHIFRKLAVLGSLQHSERLLSDKDSPFSKLLVEIGEIGRDLARAVRHNQEVSETSLHINRKHLEDPHLVTYWC